MWHYKRATVKWTAWLFAFWVHVVRPLSTVDVLLCSVLQRTKPHLNPKTLNSVSVAVTLLVKITSGSRKMSGSAIGVVAGALIARMYEILLSFVHSPSGAAADLNR